MDKRMPLNNDRLKQVTEELRHDFDQRSKRTTATLGHAEDPALTVNMHKQPAAEVSTVEVTTVKK